MIGTVTGIVIKGKLQPKFLESVVGELLTSARGFESADDVKQRVGIPYGMGSCHTAEVDGYFVEGHVPMADIKRLLRERPDAKGLTVPGMPAGSPGMEVPSGRVDAYEVILVGRDGSTSVYSRHGADAAQ